MSDSTESYTRYHTYEYYIITWLNFERVSDKLVDANVLLGEEREKISSIQGARKQNFSLVRLLYDERREFNPFLEVLASDKSCNDHRVLSRTVMARHNSKVEEQIDDDDGIFRRTRSEYRHSERPELRRNESGSDSDSSAFTYETQQFSDIYSPPGSDGERESEFEGSELERRTGTPRGDLKLPQVRQGSRNREMQEKSGPFAWLLVLVSFAMVVVTMLLKSGYKFPKFILEKMKSIC